MASGKNTVVRRVGTKQIFADMRAMISSASTWNQGDLLVFNDTLNKVVKPAAEAEGLTFLGGSTWQSLAKGASSVETDYFNGEITLLGRLHGIATPHNAYLQSLAQRMLVAGVGAASMTPEQVEAEWQAAVS